MQSDLLTQLVNCEKLFKKKGENPTKEEKETPVRKITLFDEPIYPLTARQHAKSSKQKKNDTNTTQYRKRLSISPRHS